MTSLFVLGGARSGKSRYAQQRAEALAGRHIFVATAEAWDDEMRDRIVRHRADRDARWTTIDAPYDLPEVIHGQGPDTVLLVDCLTLWTSNLLLAERDIEAATSDLIAATKAFEGILILVANEVGMGIVPDNTLARRFRDAAGRVNQAVAATAHEVVLVVAGLSLQVK
jgi:adenosylcobinamide kinase / adenosylcobinamide-phosphate guanylyltransferase